ncbi:MAG: hypothetical protein J6P60_06450 [Lachnospiraceae bacterium]|nr:hypothetical protein [Lachnospiraceae bacterium]
MYNKKQRIAALIGIVLLLALYLATLIGAIFNFDGKGHMFAACLFATIGVPILLWIYIAIYGKVTDKKTIADLFPKEDKGQQTEEAKGRVKDECSKRVGDKDEN